MLIKETPTMTESEKTAVLNTNLQYLQQLCALPLGIVFPYGGETAPNGFALCQGQSISKITYPELFSVIGYKYGGSGDNFNLPDLRGKVFVGYKDGHAVFGTFGTTVGEDEHTLTVDEMPKHKHGQSVTVDLSAAAGTYRNTIVGGGIAWHESDTNQIKDAGSDQPHNNIQTSLVGNWIIKLTTVNADWGEFILQTYDPESLLAVSGVALEQALANKVDKEPGKGLSSNDFTNSLKTKLDGIATGAEVNVQSDWNQTVNTADDYIKNKPTIPTVDQTYSPTSENAISNKTISNGLCGALHGHSSGTAISVNDVSEIQHHLGVEINGINIIAFQYTNIPTTIGGVTFTINNDGTITVDGTATAQCFLNIQTFKNIIGHKYCLSGCPAGGSSLTYYLQYGGGYMDVGNALVVSPAVVVERIIGICITSGTTISNLTFKPQFIDLTKLYGTGNEPTTFSQFKSDYPNDFYPYISDLSSVSVSVKNGNDEVVQTVTSASDGTVSGLTSISPNMTLISDNVSAVINLNYNRDINKAFEKLENLIASL